MNKSIKHKSRKNNNANPKISVLIPCHNIENNSYFSLESVLKNSYKNLEIVLLNDYSTDNTLQIINEYAVKDSRIKVYDLKDYHEHVGIGFNRHFLIEKATGKYFIFVDDDDKLHRNAIKTFVDNLDDDYDLLVAEALYSYEYAKNLRISVPEVPHFLNYDINSPIEHYYNNVSVCWGKLIKRDFYFQVVRKYNKKFSDGIYEDIRFMHMLYFTNVKFKRIKKKVYTYQIRKNSSATNLSAWSDKLKLLFSSYQSVFDDFSNLKLVEDDKLLKSLKKGLFVQLLSLCYLLCMIQKRECRTKMQQICSLMLKEFIKNNDINIAVPSNLSLWSLMIYKLSIKHFKL
ncbi:glycosyltransferase family 2 protein [Mycoplasmopsis agalactiae]|uniref:EpsG n=1 Tax=Mycoplasmopsis agalactiae TaxID=2110 RepID=D3VQ18_MYCAA|nr:glycosyltransferase family 2 protein [Mycoplasmopsis agalactiae]KAB6718762.1 glycosyltransferase family 2 protein [Mycoplasmopsis agalactiae]CBH40293.1 EpsG [Mycoplasmopsis agalactiae]